MGVNKRRNEQNQRKVKKDKILIIGMIVLIIIILIAISILLNDSNNVNTKGIEEKKYNLSIEELALEEKILTADKPVLVDYYADWCQPCVMMAPVIKELENEKKDEFYVYKVNVDTYANLAEKAGAYSIPYFALYNGGELITSTIGYQSKESLIKFVKDNI